MFFLSLLASLFCTALAMFALVRDRRSLVHQLFALGMAVLASEAALRTMSAQAALPSEVLSWERARLLSTAFVPVSWLLFSLSFARANQEQSLAKWKRTVVAVFVIPTVLAVGFSGSIFTDAYRPDFAAPWRVELGWSGYLFSLFFLLSAVVILMNLERTLQFSSGEVRWRIKFMILGLGALFAVRIYSNTQMLIFSFLDTMLETLDAGALLVADLLILFSLIRAPRLNMEIYLSQSFIYGSITVITAGLYLLAVGFLAGSIGYLGGSQTFAVAAFVVFIALLGLTSILLSHRLRHQTKRFISRHFQRPRYDYRKEWTAFTRHTASVLKIGDLCQAVAKMVAETFAVSSVSIWLWDETRQHVRLGGSTVFSGADAPGLQSFAKGVTALGRAMKEQTDPVDFDLLEAGWAVSLKQANLDCFRAARIRYCVALIANNDAAGLITLNERITKEPLSLEEFDLLRTIADQAAASIVNLKLSEQLLGAKEMEAFQAVSAFFVHDLKNLAPTLSLTVQNLRTHFDDPAFRNDALRALTQSVEKINGLCSRLALLTKQPELKISDVDLNRLVADTLASLNGAMKVCVKQDLRNVPKLRIDSEEMQKVLLNLFLNASEALNGAGEIQVRTEEKDGWVTLSVQDNGCGMSEEFIAHSLFHPLQTTKRQGLGIGLFQSRKIVEAHHGRIEVESAEGKGSTFRVILPTMRKVSGFGFQVSG